MNEISSNTIAEIRRRQKELDNEDLRQYQAAQKRDHDVLTERLKQIGADVAELTFNYLSRRVDGTWPATIVEAYLFLPEPIKIYLSGHGNIIAEGLVSDYEGGKIIAKVNVEKLLDLAFFMKEEK